MGSWDLVGVCTEKARQLFGSEFAEHKEADLCRIFNHNKEYLS